MSKVYRRLYAVLLLLAFSCSARPTLATEPVYYANGYQEDGYSYRDGYWWRGTIAHTREKRYESTTYYYYNGYQYANPRVYYYVYTPYVAPAAQAAPYVAPKALSYTPHWQDDAMSIIKEREQHAFRMQTKALDYTAYKDVVTALGFPAAPGMPSMQYPQYQQNPNAAYGAFFNQAAIGSYGASGNTVYGYQRTVNNQYSSVDVNALALQAGQNVKNAQQLGGQANTEFTNMVGSLAQLNQQTQDRVATVLAEAEAARIKLNAAQPAPQTTTTTTKAILSTNASTVPTMQRVPDDDTPAFMQRTLGPACAKCHSGATIKGGLDLSKWPTFTPAQKAVVYDRISTSDPSKRMPLADDGSPGQPLSPAQKIDVFSH